MDATPRKEPPGLAKKQTDSGVARAIGEARSAQGHGKTEADGKQDEGKKDPPGKAKGHDKNKNK